MTKPAEAQVFVDAYKKSLREFEEGQPRVRQLLP